MSDPSDTPPPGDGVIDWAAAVASHRRWLRTVVYSRVGDAHAVDEIMQNVSVAAIEQQSKSPHVSNVQAWLYQVAVRQSLTYHRRKGRENRRNREFANRRQLSESNGHAPNPLDWLLANEEREFVRLALEKLRPRDRELLLLKYTEGWSYRELSERLGIPVSTLESRLDRARRRLRSELSRNDVRGEQ